MKFAPVILGLLIMAVGCASERQIDLSSYYAQAPSLQKGYKLNATYVLRRDLILVKTDRFSYIFIRPGDGVPTVEEWRSGIRKTQIEVAAALLPAGTEVRVEKIVYLKETGSGVSHATGMLRAPGVDLLIDPFGVSGFLSDAPYGTLCLPDDRFLQIK
ncbi:MAG: hypothetical protein U1F83_08760 [Verrucomicrobiota bacterium]